MRKILLISCAAIVLSACTTSDKNYKYNNDFENIQGWFDRTDIIEHDAHSGNFCAVITPEAHFGITFRKKLAALNSGRPIRSIYVSAWIKLSEEDSKGSFVVSIDEPNTNAPIVFNPINLQDQISEPSKWEQVKNKIDVPPGTDLNKILCIYAANDGRNNIYVDDISYMFE